MPPPLNRYEKVLILILRVDAIILLTALFPSVMPFAWMKDIHRSLGMGELPDATIMGYLTRSLSLVYATHGAMQWLISLDVRRYLPLVKAIAALAIVFGLWMAVLDVAVGMPLPWIASEGPFIVLIGCVVLWLARHVQGEQRSSW